MTYSTALATINNPVITGGIGAVAGLCFPKFEQLCVSGAIAFPILKVLNIIAMTLSLYSVAQPGRLDGIRTKNLDDPKAEVDEFVNQRDNGSLLVPKGWAFLIWAPIFLGEILYVFSSSVLVKKGTSFGRMFQKSSAGFIAAQIFQVLWTATFRDKYFGKGKGWSHWMSASMLTGIAGCLNRAHVAYSSNNDFSTGIWNLIAFLPMSLHFGWTTAASLVNLNGSVAAYSDNPSTVALTGWISVLAATAVSTYVTLHRSAPIYGFVICWALSACADGMANRLEKRDQLITKANTENRWFIRKCSKESILNRKGVYGSVIQRWLCVVGAVISGAAAVWTTIQTPH